MIYIVALNTIDATAYAGRVLGIPLRSQAREACAITKSSQVPTSCVDLDIRATPQFFTMMTAASATTALIQTAVRLRGGTIKPPFDVPESMDRETVEQWLDAD